MGLKATYLIARWFTDRLILLMRSQAGRLEDFFAAIGQTVASEVIQAWRSRKSWRKL